MIQTVFPGNFGLEGGHAQCHEHIWLNKGASYNVNKALCEDSPEKSLKELKTYYSAGGRLIVDAQPTGCGRSAKQLEWLSKESGVAIVSVTGFHKKVFFDEPDLWEKSVEQLADLYTDEISIGMYENGIQTNIKAGMLKVAMENDWNKDPIYIKMFKAVAIAASRTRASIMVHTETGNDILSLIKYFDEYGIPAKRLMICHLDRTHYDMAYHIKVLEKGCYLCYDSIHRYKYVSEKEELDLIQKILMNGYDSQVVISLDTTNQRLRAYEAKDMGLDYILNTYKDVMRQHGIPEKSIDKMCKENARKILDIN